MLQPRARAREQLLTLLLRDGVLRRSPTQQIVDIDGQSARWMLDSLGVSLTAGGASLTAQALLKLLERFEGRQLATYGTIGIPLLQAVVLASKGKYRGLLVRKEVKSYGSRRRIEGRVDPREPVVMIDDSISSGFSMEHCAAHLRDAGLEVEGGVALVRFGYGGVGKLEAALGVPMLTLFDVDRDFSPRMEGEPLELANPSKVFPPLRWSSRRVENGLGPCEAARAVVDHWLSKGEALKPPLRFDREYDAAGGSFVSLRRRDDIHQRPARMGFWNFPSERSNGAAEDLVLAAVQTADELKRKSKQPRQELSRCAVAVTFFTALEECTLGEIDDRVHGIVVRSAERPSVMGGGLPRMPGLRNPWELFGHAAFNNARLHPCEPYRIFRHRLTKVVEKDIAWQASGVPKVDGDVLDERAENAAPLATRARAEVLSLLGLAARPATDFPPAPDGLEQLYLSVYQRGKLRGCVGTRVGPQAPTLRDLARAALHDERFEHRAPGSSDEVAVGVSLLRGGLDIGFADTEWIARVTRQGEQALEVFQDGVSGLLLPHVAVIDDLSKRAFATAVLDKAGLRAPPYQWVRFDCTSWLAEPQKVTRLKHGLPEGEPPASLDEARQRLRPLLLDFLERMHTGGKAEPYVRYLPFADVLKTDWAGPWLAHRAWTKTRFGLDKLAREDLAHFRAVKHGGKQWLAVPHQPTTVAELAFTALAWCSLRQPKKAVPALATIVSSILPTGRIPTGPHDDSESLQDYFPYQALLAYAVGVKNKVVKPDARIDTALAHYRRRIRGNRAWGSYAWAAQAFAAWGALRGGAPWSKLACEVVDFGLPNQSLARGCFFTPDDGDAPSALTAVYLEGVAAALAAARRLGDTSRQRRYLASLTRGWRFLDSLIYQPRDSAVLPNPAWAYGGVRTSDVMSEARIDFVQHALGVWAQLEGR